MREHVETRRIELLTGCSVQSVTATDGRIELSDGTRTATADRIVSATGFRPDHTITSELRLDLDPILGSTRALAPLIDPNEHSCGTVPPQGVDELTHPEPGYYAIGVKSYGRAATFLLATGYEQARSVVAALASGWAAARDVHLGAADSDVDRGKETDEPRSLPRHDASAFWAGAPRSIQVASGHHSLLIKHRHGPSGAATP